MSKIDRSKIGRRSKRKGKTYERRCAKLLKEFTNVNFRSTPGSGGFNKQGGVSIREELFCGDLISDDSKFLYCIEAKNREEFSFTALLKSPETASFTKWWYQCVEDARNVNMEPLLFFKPNIRDDFIVLTLEHWAKRYDNKCPHIQLKCYNTSLVFTIRLKEHNKKYTLKEITTKLPPAVMIDWKQFIKYHNPRLMFKE